MSEIKKELPSGYICKACGSSEHAIYECPNKISKKKESKTNNDTIIKSERSNKLKSPSTIQKEDRKLIITGLPFDTNKQKLQSILSEYECETTFIHLVTFSDSHKCKGIAFVTMKTNECVNKALNNINGIELGTKIIKVERIKTDTKDTTNTTNTTRKKKDKRCYRCGGDHEPNTCKNPRVCYKCRSTEHLSKFCTVKLLSLITQPIKVCISC